MEMGKEILTFMDNEIEKKIFLQSCPLRDKDIAKVLVSSKIFFGEENYKYFIGHLYNDHKVKLLHTMLPKTSTYVKIYNGQTKWMYLLLEDDDLLEKYDAI